MQRAADNLGVKFEKNAELTKLFQSKGLGDGVWRLGTISAESVIAIGPSRERGVLVMGAHGRLTPVLHPARPPKRPG